MQLLCTKVPPFSSVRNTSKQSLTQLYKTTPRETLLYNPGMILCSKPLPAVVFHGASRPVPVPMLSPAAYSRDFGPGFYSTESKDEAHRTTRIFDHSGCVTAYRLASVDGLRLLVFPKITAEWLNFIHQCRDGVGHDYDLVYGPLVDDRLRSWVNGSISGDLPQSVVLEFARFHRPTFQVSFHTRRALTRLTFFNSEPLG